MSFFTSLVGVARQVAAGTALSVLAAAAAHAQVVPLYGFASTSAPYTPLVGGVAFDPIAGGGTNDDGYSAPQTIPFSFQLGFNSYTTYVVSNNGWITFARGTTTYQTPLNAATDQMIAFFGKDLRSDGPNTAYSALTTGTAPNRIHKIEAKEFVQYGNTSAEGSVQLWLFENGTIEMHYGAFNAGWQPGSTNGVQVGLRGSGTRDVRSVSGTWPAPVPGSDASEVLPNDNTSVPAANQVFRFTLAAGDLTPPTIGAITLTPPGGSCLPTAHTVSVTPTDASGIASAELTYTAGTNPAVSVAMTRAGNVFTATIPAQGTNTVRYKVKVTDSGNNALVTESALTAYRDAGLTISAGAPVAAYVGESAVLSASSSLGGTVRITEIALFAAGGTGFTNPFPAFITAGTEDFVEISNMGGGPVDMSGYGFEVQGGGAARTYSFPSGVVVGPQEVVVLHVGAGTDDPANNYYHTGGLNDLLASGNDHAFVLTSATGQMVDYVPVNGFPVGAPATATDWSGNNVVSARNVAGVGLYGADTNSDANWADGASVPQTIGTFNAGLPMIASAAGIQWTGPGLSAPVTMNPLTTPIFTQPGTYQYIATVSNGSCTVSDTVTVTVTAATRPSVNFQASPTNPTVLQIVFLTDQSLNRPTAWRWTITPSAGVSYFGGAAHNATSNAPYVSFATAGTYTIKLRASNGAGADSLTKVNYITVGSPRYCADPQTAPCTSAYIDAVSILGTTLRNRGTGCTSGATDPGYTSFAAADSTTAAIRAGQTYSLTVNSSSAGAVGAWIDYNNNNVFDTVEYIVVSPRPNPTPGQPVTVQFTVPDSAVTTNQPVGMRIRNRRVAGMQNTSACTQAFDGETEDYLLTILPRIVGVAAPRVSALDVYPNPNTGHFRVNLTNTGARRIELALTDALGRVVHTQTGRDNTVAELQLPELATGVYFLRVQLDEEVGFRRIEIAR